MTHEVRAPTEDERDATARVMRISLNFPRAFVEDRAKVLPLHDMRCVFEGDRVVATSGERHFTQWFGGRELTMSGIWGVATLPEVRGAGLATAAVGTLLREARARGDALSGLYPATLRPYRGLGYELAGSYVTHEIRLDDLPRGAGSALPVETYDEARDLEDVRACYRRAMQEHNGPIDSDDRWWWADRILSHWSSDVIHRVVVVRGGGGIDGYASFVQETAEGDLDVSFRAACKHFVASSIEGYASLLAYFRGFRGIGQALRFTGPPDEPLSVLVEEQRVRHESNFRWMLRLLDVPAALTGRGYPPVTGEAVIAVEDGLFPDNRGPWRVVAEDGAVSVSPAEGARVRPTPIGTLSSMFTGYLSPFDAARLGILDADDPAVPLLARLFSGPAPFMLDFF